MAESDAIGAMSRKIKTFRESLKDNVLSKHVGNNCNLFASEAGRQDISITVSSQVLCALHTFGDVESAKKVCNAILDERVKRGTNCGAWIGTHGRPHITNAAWAIYASLQHNRNQVNKLENSIVWLIDAISSNDWGDATDEIFSTSLAIQALIEASKALENKTSKKALSDRIVKAIDTGVKILLTTRNRHQMSSGGSLWKQCSRDPHFCLGSTSMAIHVLAKLYNNQRETVTSTTIQDFELLVKDTLRALCSALNNAWENGDTKTRI